MNLGYEGGISVASLSDLSETRPVIDPAELRILSYPVANTSANGGTVKADIASLGGSTTKATITLYYGATATKDNSWRTIALNGTYGEWETASYTITDMTGSPLVYYYFTASSGNLTDTTDMRSFKIATPPAVTYTREAPFYAVLRNTAKLVFNYKDSGGVATAYIRLIDSATNEETQIPINYGNPLVAGDYLVEITGLKAGTTYEATLLATNDAGTTTLDTYTITTRPESGSVFYIAPTAAGLEDGSTPANAASDINAVTTEATYTGDEIRFLKGNYGYDTAINVNSAQGLTIAGGYDQDGKVVGISTITNYRSITSSSHRLIKAASSTHTKRNLHFNGGYYYEVNFSVDGNALLLSSCNTTIENCTFSENALRVTTGYHVYGVVIGAKNGTLAVRDSIFTNNVTESVNFKATGNAIGATSLTKLTIERTTFADNALAPLHNRSTYGGAIALTSCTDATISSCTFTNNINATGKHYASSWSSEGSVGGHLYITGTTLKINDTTFSGGFTIFEGGSLAGNGGAIYATGGSKLIINRSYFLDGGRTTLAGTSTSQRYAYNTGTGSIDASGSSTYVYMTNVLVRGNNRGHIFYNSGATYDIVNCTITGNKADTQLTTLVNSIYKQNNGKASFKNTIIYGNAGNIFYADSLGTPPTFEYCCLQEDWDGDGNITDDPLFADITYCHPSSKAGSIHGAYLTGGTFTADTTTSPAIDAGAAKFTSYAGEPQPNGNKVNIGYDGGTTAASRTVLSETNPFVTPDALQIFSYPASEISAKGALTEATIASLAGSSSKATVTLAYGATATPDSTWESVTLGTTYGEWDAISYTITDMAGNSTVYFQYTVTLNGKSASSDIRSFELAMPPQIAYASPNAITALFRTKATLNFIHTDSGSATTAKVVVTAEDEEERTFDANNGLNLEEDTYQVALTGLTPGVTYNATLTAENSAGTTTLDPLTFTPVSSETPRIFYIGETSSGKEDGTSFDNTASDINDIASELIAVGDEIRLLQGGIDFGKAITLSNLPGLTIVGGYDKNGNIVGTTSITNNPALNSTHRLFYAENSTLTFKNINFLNGCVYNNNANFNGNALYLSNCHTTIENCTFKGNSRIKSMSGNGPWVYGFVIHANQGSIKIKDSRFEENRTGSINHYSYGNCLYAYKLSNAEITDTTFKNNTIAPVHNRTNRGGALYFEGCTTASVASCTFTNNICAITGNVGWSPNGTCGGSIYTRTTPLTITDTDFIGGYTVYHVSSTQSGTGGFIYQESGNVSINRCKFENGGTTGQTTSSTDNRPAYNVGLGSIDVASGNLTISNSLFAATKRGHTIGNSGGTINLVNCTIASATAKTKYTSLPNVVYKHQKGTTNFKNCIIWGNEVPFILDTTTTSDYTATHSIIEGLTDEANNVYSKDPKYVDAASHNYRLAPYSAARNKGDAAGINRQTETDLDGTPRVVGKTIDLGAYESQRDPTMIILR